MRSDGGVAVLGRTGGTGTTGVLRAASPAVVAPACAVLAVGCLLAGLSYPGYPVDAAACAALAGLTSLVVAVVTGARARRSGRGRRRALVVLTLVAAVLVAGVLVARADDGHRLQARWAGSQPAFEREVQAAGDPVRADGSGSGRPARYPGACPVRIGGFSVVECRSVDGGYLFLQSPDALTDDSGIVYLPDPAAGPSWGSTDTMTPLGGPWWSWTCRC